MKKVILILGVCVILIFTGCIGYTLTQENPAQHLKITYVIDGDTVKGILNEKTPVTIRLADIDCFESSEKSPKLMQQSIAAHLPPEQVLQKGRDAKNMLKKLLKSHKNEVVFVPTPEKVCKTGNGDRLVGSVYAGGIHVNDYMREQAGCMPFSCTTGAVINTPK